MNYKKEELIDQFVETVKKRFPELEFMKITDGADDPDDVWVHFIVPDDEDKMTEVSEFTGYLTSDLLIEFGWLIIICQHPVKYAKAA